MERRRKEAMEAKWTAARPQVTYGGSGGGIRMRSLMNGTRAEGEAGCSACSRAARLPHAAAAIMWLDKREAGSGTSDSSRVASLCLSEIMTR